MYLRKVSVQMELKKPLKVKCQNCGTIIDADLDFECVSTNERDMGTEFDYEGVFEGVCPGCGKDIFIKVEAYEYPEGVVNYLDNQVLVGVTLENE